MPKKFIGLEAEEPGKKCNDPKCPWHGKLSLRGRVFQGEVISDRGWKTVVVKWGFHRFIQKYERYERRTTKVYAYNPECIDAKIGDTVKIAECRPLSKTKSFAVIEVIKKKGVKT